jgi:hypothetical protein
VTSHAGRLLSTIDRARDGLALDAGLYLLSAAFALLTGLSSTLLPHRAWGLIAMWAYLGALLVVIVQLVLRRPAARMPLTWAAWAGTALLPLVVEAVQRAGGRTARAQDEVLVVEQMGERLLHAGTPYLAPPAIAGLPADEQLGAYSPYQPGMAIFGLPRALAGDAWWTDARVWFALVTAAVLATALAMLASGERGGALLRAAQAATVLPICALTLAVGGDDLPVLALCLLALAFTARDRPLAAGVAVGLAGALKLFAWPVALVLLAYAATRGRRALVAYAVPSLGLPVAAVLPSLAVDPGAAVENLVRFPLGHGLVSSPAASPLPGHLIATALPGGRAVAAALLVVAGLVIGWWLLRRPPRDAGRAAVMCAYGLAIAIALMPATRFGYLLYPVAYLVWWPALRQPGSRTAVAGRTQGE